MIPLTLHQVRIAMGGRSLSLIPDEAATVTAVCIDSRHMAPASLFVAIRGDHFDGHAFLADAARGGALAAIVETAPVDAPATLPLIQTPDARVALGRLARYVRERLRAKVIAVGGSNGKTSTKHLIHAALRGKLKGSISPKSYNNNIGVPLAIFPADPSHDYLVLEMGTNHHGEIRPLSDMAQPDIAVITNCGAEHLEGLTDLAGVRRENAQITSGLNPKGMLVVNGDDRELLAAVNDWPGRKLTFGFGPGNDLFATDVCSVPRGTEFSVNGRSRRVFVPMLGRHAAANALAAIGVARALRVPEETIIQSLATSEGPDMRLQLQSAGEITLLNDAYNANPNSMHAAIDTLVNIPTVGRRIAILGDMRELGDAADRFHREIGQAVAKAGKIDLLICVGKDAVLIADAAAGAGLIAANIRRFENADAAAAMVNQLLLPDDLVLLKASRGIRLEIVAAAICNHFRKAASLTLS